MCWRYWRIFFSLWEWKGKFKLFNIKFFKYDMLNSLYWKKNSHFIVQILYKYIISKTTFIQLFICLHMCVKIFSFLLLYAILMMLRKTFLLLQIVRNIFSVFKDLCCYCSCFSFTKTVRKKNGVYMMIVKFWVD